ncbi:MAG: FKBP-type peptidyl-prolyl cis-trans isomerase [Saprospiraceae bacterium]
MLLVTTQLHLVSKAEQRVFRSRLENWRIKKRKPTSKSNQKMKKLGLFFLFFTIFSSTIAQPDGNLEWGFIHHISRGGPKPKAGEYICFQLIMTNGDSVFFDSHTQAEMPIVAIPTTEKMKGQKPNPVLSAMLLMSEGDSLSVFYPVDSLGPAPPFGFENAEYIVYHISLKSIKTAEQYNREILAKVDTSEAILKSIREQTKSLLEEYNNNNLGSKLITTESGLQYVLVKEGKGRIATEGETVRSHYYGILTDGTEFDNSYSRGNPFSFKVGIGQVIRGWDEAFSTLKSGSKVVLFIPPELGHGANGNAIIPANSSLVFFIDIIE